MPQDPMNPNWQSQSRQPVPPEWAGAQPYSPQGGGYEPQQPGPFGQRWPYASPNPPVTHVWQPPTPPVPDTRENARRRQDSVRRKHPFPWKLALLAAVCVGLIVAAAVMLPPWLQQRQIERAVAPYDNVFCEGVWVDGINLGGLSWQEARAAVEEQASHHSGWGVRLLLDGEEARQISASDLGVQVDIDGALQSAWLQGHAGTAEERYAAQQALAEDPYHGYSATPGDTTVIDAILAETAAAVYVPAKDAQMVRFDPDYTDPFIFEAEQTGRVLYTDAVRDQIYQMYSDLRGGDIVLEPEVLQPQVTEQWLRDNLYTVRGTASTPISSTSTENRNNNIRRAFELIAGTEIAPGGTFSFNGVVGERSLKNGFFEADEYVYEEVTTGIGGGVCQASTTIYQAAVRAGMTITERKPHSMAVRYTDKGKDATVYWYSNHRIDLKFKNPTDYPIYITAAVQSDASNRKKLNARVTIYGAAMGNVKYDFDVLEIEIPAPEEPEIREDKKNEYVTYTDEEYVLREASPGYTVESYRVTYVNGVETEREHLATDTYKPKSQIIYVGINDPLTAEE